MKQSLLERAVALATGEALSTIRRMGFSLFDPTAADEDFDELPRPRTVNWDRLDASRPAYPAAACPLASEARMILFLLNYLTRRTTIDYDYPPLGPATSHGLTPCLRQLPRHRPRHRFHRRQGGADREVQFGDVAVEFRVPGERTAETLWLPFEFLDDVEGKKDDPVDIDSADNGQVSVQWRDGNVPQIVDVRLDAAA